MPAFSFEAIDAQGQPRKGTIEADSPKAARSLLRAQALVPLGVEPLASSAQAQGGAVPGLGEQTGQLPVMLQRAAIQLSAEVQRRSMQLATILEPLLIVAMGLVVMLIVLAVLMPIIQLNQFVK